jgi:cold shock CspA family protein
MRVGVVAVFDADAGFGTVRDDDGKEHFFHCTRIADGTRTIAEGIRVAFILEPGHRGRWEATRVLPV